MPKKRKGLVVKSPYASALSSKIFTHKIKPSKKTYKRKGRNNVK